MNLHPIVTTARELQPLIRQYLVEGERRARLTPEVVTAVGKVGLFRALAPQEVGGLEVSPPVLLAVLEAVSAADPAVGWYIANSQPTCLAIATLAEKERALLFAAPDRNFGYSGAQVGQAIPTDGGYRVSGQWPVVSGCEDAKRRFRRCSISTMWISNRRGPCCDRLVLELTRTDFTTTLRVHEWSSREQHEESASLGDTYDAFGSTT